LATAALVARNGHPFSIGIGAVLALWTVTVLRPGRVRASASFSRPGCSNIVSGLLFAAIGLYIIGSTLFA